jgi:hypothetical protein
MNSLSSGWICFETLKFVKLLYLIYDQIVLCIIFWHYKIFFRTYFQSQITSEVAMLDILKRSLLVFSSSSVFFLFDVVERTDYVQQLISISKNWNCINQIKSLVIGRRTPLLYYWLILISLWLEEQVFFSCVEEPWLPPNRRQRGFFLKVDLGWVPAFCKQLYYFL